MMTKNRIFPALQSPSLASFAWICSFVRKSLDLPTFRESCSLQGGACSPIKRCSVHEHSTTGAQVLTYFGELGESDFLIWAMVFEFLFTEYKLERVNLVGLIVTMG